MGLNPRGARKAALSTDLLYKMPVSFPLVTSCWIKQAARRWTYSYVYRREAGRRPGGRSVWPGPEDEGGYIVCVHGGSEEQDNGTASAYMLKVAKYKAALGEGGGEGAMTSICCLTCWRM